MTVPYDEVFTLEPEPRLADGNRYSTTRRSALPLAKSIIDAAQTEAERLIEQARRDAAVLAHEATQSGYDEGMNRAAGQIFAAAELEYRSATAVIRYALPILCDALGREFGLGRKIAAMEAAVLEALRQKRLTPPCVITVSALGVAAVQRILARNGATEQVARVEIDQEMAAGSCRIANSGGSIEIDVEGHLEGFLRRLARHQELRDALIEDLVECVAAQQ